MNTQKITIIKIEGAATDVFLDSQGTGKGKITVSDTEMDYNFSHYWGVMGCDLEKFIKSIDPGYFAGKLCGEHWIMDLKKTMANVRSCIKEELPWYKFPTAQKELREELNDIQNSVETKEGFVNAMEDLADNVHCFELDIQERREFKDTLKSAIEHPWYLIVEKPSQQYQWLEGLLPKIQKKL